MTSPAADVARRAVAASFVLNGFCFATWVSRIPEVRATFDLTNAGLGTLLLALAVGSLLALPTTGSAVAAYGTVRVVRAGVLLAATGLVVAAAGLGAGQDGALPVTAVGLFTYGVGTGVWDVAMNVEGAEVERRLGRSVMPRFHAGFSLGTVVGALLGAAALAVGVPALAHLGGVAGLAGVVAVASAAAFLPVAGPDPERPHALRAWLEPRTLLIGVLVLALALTEGTANDWLAVALVDGFGVAPSLGVAGFAVFVAAMTAGRWWGSALLDRFGRLAVLWTTIGLAASGVLLIVFGAHPALVVLGIVLWGVGASLGFPVGMSAAADDPLRAAARVSVVSTIGYAAFLAGPPLLGFVGDRVGTLPALLVVSVLLVPAALVVPATRPLSPRRAPRPASTARRRAPGSRGGRG